MLAPLAVTGSDIVDAGEEMELVQRDLVCFDSKLLVKLALSSTLDAHDGSLEGRASLAGDTKRMRAAGVGPHVGESDLLRGSLLQQETVLVVEKEDGKGAVQQTLLNVLHQVASKTESATEPQVQKGRTELYIQTFLLALPMGKSFSSRTMQTSSMRRICSSS